MDLYLLAALLMVYNNNFKVLHWSARGEKFDRMHNIAANYDYETNQDLDKVAEMILRIEPNPGNKFPTALTAIEMLKNYQTMSFLVYEGVETHDWTTFCKETEQMLTDICRVIEGVLQNDEIKDIHSAGIKSDLESMHSKWDLQARYLHARRRV